MALAYKDDIPWGAALRFHVEAQPGGTNRVVQCIQNEVGKIIGSRVTFMRLYFSGGPEMLEEKDQQRAWFLTAAIGKPASDWGIVDAVLPGAWFRDRKGHESIQTTMTYVNLVAERPRQVVAALPWVA